MTETTDTQALSISPSAAPAGSGGDVLTMLKTLHARAEAAQWSAVEDDGEMNNKHRTMDEFNVAAWNYGPLVISALETMQEELDNFITEHPILATKEVRQILRDSQTALHQNR